MRGLRTQEQLRQNALRPSSDLDPQRAGATSLPTAAAELRKTNRRLRYTKRRAGRQDADKTSHEYSGARLDTARNQPKSATFRWTPRLSSKMAAQKPETAEFLAMYMRAIFRRGRTSRRSLGLSMLRTAPVFPVSDVRDRSYPVAASRFQARLEG